MMTHCERVNQAADEREMVYCHGVGFRAVVTIMNEGASSGERNVHTREYLLKVPSSWRQMHAEPGLEVWAESEPRRGAFVANVVLTRFEGASASLDDDLNALGHAQLISRDAWTVGEAVGVRRLLSHTTDDGVEVTTEQVVIVDCHDGADVVTTMSLSCFTPDFPDLTETFETIIGTLAPRDVPT